jgi:hypothetical protein
MKIHTAFLLDQNDNGAKNLQAETFTIDFCLFNAISKLH